MMAGGRGRRQAGAITPGPPGQNPGRQSAAGDAKRQGMVECQAATINSQLRRPGSTPLVASAILELELAQVLRRHDLGWPEDDFAVDADLILAQATGLEGFAGFA